jgi:copper/silver efflux system protein
VIEKIIEYSIRAPLVVLFLATGVALWGLHATLNTPVDAIPDLSENQVIVFADWPGRSPKEMEDQVTYPLSVNLQGLAGVKAIRANSEFGFSMLNIIFEEGVDFYFARQRVLEKLSIASTYLPADVRPYLAPDTTALGQIYWYTVEGDGYDMGRLRAIQDWYVRYQLYSVPGVAEVASVGGFPIEYQIDIDPNKLRSYGLTLGELYTAVARSNSSVGGRVVQKGNSEYLVRSTGWIRSLEDVERTVIKSIAGTPVHVGDVASVQMGSAERRSVLEKEGSEAVGGVVLMRFGENPLVVTERIKEKVQQLQAGLPEGVRIVPFYDRTELIHGAVETVTGSLIEEALVASAVIFLVMRHVRSALIICAMLPLSVLISFILMRQLGISSNIMSLSGIAISVGVLVDAAIVMVDQAAHTLHERFGKGPVRGDTRELLLPALRTVGRPIFFSLAIMILSFVPVFAMSGMEGKMFHPLAYTKSFALVGVSILAITLVPAVIPWLLRGRIRHETDSWLVRRVIEIYRPVLNFVMDHPWPVVWTVAVICIVGSVPVGSKPVFLIALAMALVMAAWASWGEEDSFRRHWRSVGVLWAVSVAIPLVVALFGGWDPGMLPAAWHRHKIAVIATLMLAVFTVSLSGVWLLSRIRFAATVTMLGSLVLVALIAQQAIVPLGREFMPPLNEGSILDMPVTIPRASVTQVAADLKARNAEIRAVPEIAVVVGKAGRAETPTDPAPLDMVETVINLRPREFWTKRELRYEDALRHLQRTAAALQTHGFLRSDLDPEELEQIVNTATMHVIERFDGNMRSMVLQEQLAFEQKLTPDLLHRSVEEAIQLMYRNGSLTREILPGELRALVAGVPPQLAQQLSEHADELVVRKIGLAVLTQLDELGVLSRDKEAFSVARGPVETATLSIGELFGLERPGFHDEVLRATLAHEKTRWAAFVKELNWRLFDAAVPMLTHLGIEELRRVALETDAWTGDASLERLITLRETLHGTLKSELFLWQRDKASLLTELDSVVRMPGWGNIWTQPIINRIDMLATGVNTMLGVRVFGDDIEQIASKSSEIAEVLKKLRGAVDVSADQVVGEGYLEIDIDRQRAARYGVNVGDIQDVIETALGGREITMTVEGRQRFPVRIRYARAFREDEESVANLLISASGSAAGAMGTGPMAESSSVEPIAATRSAPLQVPLSQVADIRIVQGPSMIRSENGLLRSYVRLNVRDRDIIGFVEEARQAVASAVEMPPGMYVEWTGQFEHELRARRTLSIIVPVVVLTIFILLFVVYHDLADTLIVMCLTVPGAVFGGVLFQYLFGYNFSVAVWVGFIACFGLATEGGLVILVYLREAIERRGGLEELSLEQVREAVMEGAVHRLRPKLMTELTTMIGLAPMLWASGTGSEIMQPMAAPVLGGILVADEVIDLLLPVLFYRVRAYRWKKLRAVRASRGGVEDGLGHAAASVGAQTQFAPYNDEQLRVDLVPGQGVVADAAPSANAE